MGEWNAQGGWCQALFRLKKGRDTPFKTIDTVLQRPVLPVVCSVWQRGGLFFPGGELLDEGVGLAMVLALPVRE